MKNIKESDERLLRKAKQIADRAISLIETDGKNKSEFDDAIADNSHVGSYLEKMADSDTVSTICKNYDRAEKECEAERFLKTIQHKQRHRKQALIATFSLTAALIAVSFLVWVNPNEKPVTLAQNLKDENITQPTLIQNNGNRLLLGQEITMNVSDSSISYDMSKQEKTTQLEYDKIVIPSQYTYKVTLSDGTVVMLNANSSLRFPRQFGTDERRVYLEGEAYFSVTKSDVPFIVESKEMRLRVYGTQFNVNTNSAGQAEAILVEGSVGIQAKKGDHEYMMKPSQQAIVCENGKVNVSTVNTAKYLSWLNGCFIMELDPADRLLTEIERWYGVTFIYPDNFDKEKLFSVQISRDMKIEELLESLETVLNVEFSKERSNVYRIKSRR